MSQAKDGQAFRKALSNGCAILAGVGLVCYALQAAMGLRVTNLSNVNTWGLYIVGFMVFTGIAAGSLLFSSSACLCSRMAEYRPYARVAALVGTLCGVVAAGLFIMVDVGHPLRVWRFFTAPNPQSSLLWDAGVLAAYLVIGVVFFLRLKGVGRGDEVEGSLKVVAALAFVAGLAVVITAFAYAREPGSFLWNRIGQPLSFLTSAVVLALAWLLLVFTSLGKSGFMKADAEKLARLGRAASLFLFGDLLLVGGGVAHHAFSGNVEASAIARWMLVGHGAVPFWLGIAASLAALVLLRRGPGVPVAGAWVALFAGVMNKHTMLQARMLNPSFDYPGLPEHFGAAAVYVPSLIELGVAVGIIALTGLLAKIGLERFAPEVEH